MEVSIIFIQYSSLGILLFHQIFLVTSYFARDHSCAMFLLYFSIILIIVLQRLHLVQQSPPFYIPSEYINYRLDTKIRCEGELGIVKKFDSLDGSPSIAIKKFTHTPEDSDRAKLVLNEINLRQTLQHENIVKFLGAYSEGREGAESIYYITEHCGDPLSKRIWHGRYSIKEAKKWTSELLSAVQFLHSNGIVHRNLHPFNICIDTNNKLRLITLGANRAINRDESTLSSTQPYSPIELMVEWKCALDGKVDIWSISALLCEMFTGQPLFVRELAGSTLQLQIEYCGPIEEAVIAKVVSTSIRCSLQDNSKTAVRKDLFKLLRENMMPGRGIGEAELLSTEPLLRDFLEHTLQFDPDRRISAEYALAHPFLQISQ
ncbi:hypothetical protein PENTCL1PPCAC_5535 [Pristionchus entomophagus]|uniref:Protein kinase domain-containing protein n=1 Tax=Pristionchus entomophagus TaxID=358040 RepID=A0AAV5SKA3_9BILA|nr:hypothetical protein PENTCL1PPCAC_5535 [Pristionchus entomophagus]